MLIIYSGFWKGPQVSNVPPQRALSHAVEIEVKQFGQHQDHLQRKTEHKTIVSNYGGSEGNTGATLKSEFLTRKNGLTSDTFPALTQSRLKPTPLTEFCKRQESNLDP